MPFGVWKQHEEVSVSGKSGLTAVARFIGRLATVGPRRKRSVPLYRIRPVGIRDRARERAR
jgi:hypothetical protein